jgi:uncharacterized protein
MTTLKPLNNDPKNADNQQNALDAAVFRRLLAHFDEHKEIQNIDIMNTAGFCRNCLSKWYLAAAHEQGVALDDAAARLRIYGMPYEEWKQKYQTPKTQK